MTTTQHDWNGHIPDPNTMTHDELCHLVERYCDRYGLAWHHDQDGPRGRGTPGFPDYTIAGPYGVLFREIKPEGGTLDTKQRHWRDLLIAGGADWGCWRPIDLPLERIHQELRAIAGQTA